MDKIQGVVLWIFVLILALMLFVLAITGRLGIVLSVALVPDNVAYIGS